MQSVTALPLPVTLISLRSFVGDRRRRFLTPGKGVAVDDFRNIVAHFFHLTHQFPDRPHVIILQELTHPPHGIPQGAALFLSDLLFEFLECPHRRVDKRFCLVAHFGVLPFSHVDNRLVGGVLSHFFNFFLVRPPEALILIVCLWSVPLFRAETWTIPLASTSKDTSIFGTPLGAGGIPRSSNCPSDLLSAAISLSP